MTSSRDPIITAACKLRTVSEIFCDHALNQALKENKYLKLCLFWKDHNLEKLKKAMQYANSETGPRCSCLTCSISGRTPEGSARAYDSDVCYFKQWFESLLMQLGLSVQQSEMNNEQRAHICLTGDDRECPYASIYDDDAHFAHVSGRHDWFWFTYGSKVWKAKSTSDPELQKLKSLFQILNKKKQSNSDSEP